jgi:hypothetical protein
MDLYAGQARNVPYVAKPRRFPSSSSAPRTGKRDAVLVANQGSVVAGDRGT